MLIGVPLSKEEIRESWIEPYGLGISPDGAWVGLLYLRAGRYRLGLFPTTSDDGAREIALPYGQPGGLVWSPNADAVAFFAGQPDSSETNIFVLDLASGDMTARMTESGWVAFIPSWSPDGTELVFSAYPVPRHPEGRPRLFLASLPEGEVRQLTAGEHTDLRPHFSPDGHVLIFRRAWEAWRLDLADGSERQLLTEEGHDFEPHFGCFSPDGAQIVIQRSIVDGGQILITDVSTAATRALTDATNADLRPSWSPSGNAIAFVRNRNRVVVAGLDGAILWEAAPRNGRIVAGLNTGVQWARNAEVLAFMDRDGNAWVADANTSARQVTHFGEPPRVKQQPKQVSCPSTSGAHVPALLLEPPGFVPGRNPAVVWLHGGPFQEAATDLMLTVSSCYIAALLEAGFLVILPDYRGSTGHGEAWEWVRSEQRGIVDVDDVVATKRFLEDNGLAASGNTAVVGYSYGGYLTFMALARHSENWACAASLWGILDPVHIRSTWILDGEQWPDLTQRTPLNLLHQMRAPLLILHGGHDTYSPNEEVRRASETIRSCGTPCDLHIFDDTHGLPLHIDEGAKLVVEFLTKHT